MACPFENLPPELHLLILHHLEDTITLHDLVLASPNACAQYLRSAGSVLCSVLCHLPCDVAELASRIFHTENTTNIRFEKRVGRQSIDYYNTLFAAKPMLVLRSLADTPREIHYLTEWCQQRQEEEYAGGPGAWQGYDQARRTGGRQWSRPAACILRALWQLTLYVVHMQKERRYNNVFANFPPPATAQEERQRQQAMLKACDYDFGRLPQTELSMIADVLRTLMTGGSDGRLVRALIGADAEAPDWVPCAWMTILGCAIAPH
ncbi:hypothetical protein LTR85_012187 [Meristemomyces frigidus]|nr:hypothetical protein LTR85_012187 [Meristemomyces frigidus]